MVEEHVQRRLAAILVADVVGYARQMEHDQEGTLARLKALRADIVEPTIAGHRGRVFKTTGDGVLAEFPSSVESVRCAVDIQRAVERRNADVPGDRQVTLRMGISLGDVMIDGDDVFGNGVNVAARLEALAEPGSICISANVHEHVRDLADIALADIGEHRVKNIETPIRVYRIDPARHRLDRAPAMTGSQQTVRFCRARDGTGIAYATIGSGPPVVRAGHWISHLELEWQMPARRELIQLLARDRMLVRYDQRGNGLSDLEVEDFSFEALLSDLEAVVEDLALDRFALFGQSQGSAMAAVYAARHPDKVTHLVLYGGYVRGRRQRGSDADLAESDAFISLIRNGWGKDHPAYVQMFGSFFMPDAGPEEMAGFVAAQRATTTPENAARTRFAIDDIDISAELGKIRAPTLVLHARQDAMAPFAEGRRLAAAIAGAQFVQLEGRNHILLPGEPAWARFNQEVEAFLAI